MNLEPYRLFDIINAGKVKLFQITKITYDIEAKLNHTLDSTDYPLTDNTPETCKKHNDGQVKLLLESKAEIERYVNQFNGGTKRLAQRDYIVNTLEHFRNWYNEQGLDFLDSDGHTQYPERKPKYQEYEELFNKFYSDPNAEPEKVKEILNNKPHWKNPSQYLSQARRKAEITVSELKAHPGFIWIDPKGTAID